MILTSKEARELLETERKNAKDDRWIEHSICVGDSAGILAKALNEKGYNIDVDKAITLGYVHDIGKYTGESHGHVMRGYEYLKNKGYDEEYANICLTHSYLNNDILCTAGGVPDKEKNPFLTDFIEKHEYTIEEKIINLFDLMCTTKTLTMDKRLIDIVLRKGVFFNTQYHVKETYKLKEYFDNLLGYNLYDLFPEIKENVIKYYVMCNKLKNVIRTGWKTWNVERERVESVAEHIFGVQMLAIAMKSEYEYDIDIMKVIFMLAVHELGEIVIGDLTMFEISKEEKAKREKEAVHKILCGLLDGKEIENLFTEFNSHSTKEAMFAYQCDKLECDLQSKLYDEEGCVDLNKQEGNDLLENELVKKLLSEEKSWSRMWLRFGQTVYPYDDNFKNVSKHALNNNISKKGLNK